MRWQYGMAWALSAATLPVIACNAILGNESGVLGDAGVDASDAWTPPTPLPPVPGDDAGIPPAPAPDAAIDVDTGAPPSPPTSTCAPGQKRCDGTCESLQDPRFGCGATTCDPCTLTRASAQCVGGACAIATCNPGYADCDANPANGCETDLSAPEHCGSCNARCAAAAPVCAPTTNGFACTTGCTGAAPTRCGNQCVDLLTSIHHCGSCNIDCPAVTNGTTTCNAGVCGFTCQAGFHACGNACVSDEDPATCGARCTPCATPANGKSTCSAGACGFACNAGFHACGAVCASSTDPSTCGASCAPCPSGPFSTPTCNGVTCGLACNPGRANCDANAANGCEVDLATDAANCGACGVSCGAQPCVNGACAAPPPPPPPQDGGNDAGDGGP